MANSVDPDQTALGAVWVVSTLFAHNYFSKYLAWYFIPLIPTFYFFFFFFFWENMKTIARFHQEN